MTEVGERTQVGDMSEKGESGTPTVPDRWRALPGWAVLIGGAVAFWVVGFLPWIVEGMHLEVSSAWPRFDTLQGPVVALPFGEYAFGPLLVSGIIGGAAALATSRLAAPWVAHPRLIAGVGALIAVVLSLAQTVWTVWPALAPMTEARILVVALVVAALGSGLIGVLVGAGVAREGGWPWLLGGATVAALSGSWIVDVIARNGAGEPDWVLRVAQWHPWVSGLVLGLVLAVFGLRPAKRLIGWVVALAIAWFVPVLLTMLVFVTYYASRGPLRENEIGNVLESARRELGYALLPSHRSLWPLVLAVVLGVAGATWRLRESSDPRS